MDKKAINIENINKYIIHKKINWTRHCLNRMNKRSISVSDVKNAIKKGKIIEIYYDDYPYPSCLILGKNNSNRKMHIVCGISEEFLWMITAYYPDSDKWENDMKTRRENNELFYV